MVPPVENPYSKENEVKRKQREEDHLKKQASQRTLQRLMDGGKSKKKKRAKRSKKDPERSRRAKKAAKTRENKKREKRKLHAREEDETGDDGTIAGSFRPSTLKMYEKLSKRLKKSVGFDKNGKHEPYGKWPALFAGPLVDPSSDPMIFHSTELGEDGAPLCREDFAVPPIMFFGPEDRWRDLCRPDYRPCCPFHPGKTDCVKHLGYSHYVRRAHSENQNDGLVGRRYYCETKKSECRDETYTFYSYDSAVLSQAPAYVQGWWRRHGYRMTSRGAIKWSLIDQMRSMLAYGLSALGFVKALTERHKQNHSATSKMWRSYVDYYNTTAPPGQQRIAKRSLYFDFDDVRCETQLPSLSYLLEATVQEIEAKIPYYRHKMTMNGGLFLSGDHFIKIGKVILIENQRGFVGMYSVMNEFGKILLFRFVSGTTLYEVEDSLRGLNRRYKLHGFKGPIIFTTDRCCDERGFYEGKRNGKEEPIFDSFAPIHSFVPESKEEMEHAPNRDKETVSSTEADEATPEGYKSVQYLDVPSKPVTFSTRAVADATANDIIAKCEEKNWKVLSIDSEWVVGPKEGPDIIQVTTRDLETYIFEKPFPKGLKTLLESTEILKVASRISADRSKLEQIGITLRNYGSLQQMAYEGHRSSYAPEVEDPFSSAGNDLDEDLNAPFDDVDNCADEELAGGSETQKMGVAVAPFAGNLPKGRIPSDYKAQEPSVDRSKKAPAPKKKKRAPRRCRQCGMTKKFAQYPQYHEGAGVREGVSPAMACTAPPTERLPGFPAGDKTRLNRIPS